MEIERKWLTDGWPQGLEEQRCILMRQGYITTRPTVRIRSEASGDVTEYVLCFKGAAGPDGLAREEIETNIAPDLFAKLEAFIGRPLIEKEQRRYALPGGLSLEVNQVDRGRPGEFFYAEVEFPTREAALESLSATRSPASPGRVWRPTGPRRGENFNSIFWKGKKRVNSPFRACRTQEN